MKDFISGIQNIKIIQSTIFSFCSMHFQLFYYLEKKYHSTETMNIPSNLKDARHSANSHGHGFTTVTCNAKEKMDEEQSTTDQ